jgi:hypothetical protein
MTVRVLLIITVVALNSVRAQYCLPGAVQATCEAVLVVHSANFSYAEDVQTKLRGTGAFTTVDTFDATFVTPTSSQLGAYDAIFLFNNRSFSDDARIGDLLAAFHDQGGGVVVANLPWNSHTLKGAYGTPANGYALFDNTFGDLTSTADSLGDLLEPQSPLLTDVDTLAALVAYRSTAPVINSGAVVARWRGGGREPLVVRGVRGNRTLVELNLFPVSSSINLALWTGDGTALMRNALKYSRCMPCRAGTYSVAGEHHSSQGRAAARGCKAGEYFDVLARDDA